MLIFMSTTFILLAFASASQTFALPKDLLSSLCFIESAHRPHVVHNHDGKGNSVGICQIKLATASMLGFKGTENDLKDPIVNIHYAAKYLAKQIGRYDGNIAKGVAAYNAGSYKANKLGVAFNHNYVMKVFAQWEKAA